MRVIERSSFVSVGIFSSSGRSASATQLDRRSTETTCPASFFSTCPPAFRIQLVGSTARAAARNKACILTSSPVWQQRFTIKDNLTVGEGFFQIVVSVFSNQCVIEIEVPQIFQCAEC